MPQAASDRIDRDFKLRGPGAKYYLYKGMEALLEGGTRCGKSYALLIKAKDVADRYPGSKQLIVRQTRKSLNESVLKDWRDDILWLGHEAVSSTSSRDHQDRYTWRNGSEVVFAGLENARDTSSPILSTKWDRIAVVQAEETSQSDWELLCTRLSSFQTPYLQITADCNPAAPSHWLNQRFAEDRCGENRQRFRFRHYDNPFLYTGLYPNGQWTKEGATYMAILESTLTGVRRERFLLSKWVAAEGQILENWDPRIHSIDGKLEKDGNYGWVIHAPSVSQQPIRIAYFTAGVDFGWKPDPGAMQLWAYDSPRWHPLIRRFRVAEVMKLEWQREQFVEVAEDWHAKYDVRWFSCDPSDPENISYFNIRLGKRNYRNAPKLAIKCPPIGGGHQRAKNKTAQIDLMREGLGSATGHVRSYFLKDAFPEGIDEELRRRGLPTCFEAEAESWVYDVDPQGNPTEKPSRKQGSHANAIYCFPAGTMIETELGGVPIETIRPGDGVLVPYNDDVVATWASNEEREIWELDTGVGPLRGTGSHRLWTVRGWRKLAEISGEALLGWRRSASTTASPGGAIRAVRTMPQLTTSEPTSWDKAYICTTTSGSARWAPEGSGATSTIATETTRTIQPRISSSSPQVNIAPSIGQARPLWRASSNGYTLTVARRSELLRLRDSGRPESRDNELARYVDECSGRRTEVRASNLAARNVTSVASRRLTPHTIETGSARIVARERVYSLTTRRSSRYIANGIMVANCAMYDETLSFVRGFGRMPAQDAVRYAPGSDDADLAKFMRERNEENRKSKQRRAPWA